jgi:enoyl-CoA hydratase/carnithine racemase
VIELIEERRGDVLWLTFNRPQARNAMTFEMYERLGELAREVNQDDSVRCVVLTGAGEKAFVAGTDISQFKDFKTEQDSIDYEDRMEREIGSLAAIRVPTIAAVRGACTGGGFAIAGACDIRVASPSARFGIPIARTLGNCLSMASLNLLIDLMGPSRAKEMVFTARLIEAPEAREIGIANELVDSEEALMPRVEALAGQIAANAPLTIRAIKEGVRRIMALRHLDAALGRDLVVACYMSADFREGMEAFLEKRKPNWQGR